MECVRGSKDEFGKFGGLLEKVQKIYRMQETS